MSELDRKARVRICERQQPEEEISHPVDGLADPCFLQLGPRACAEVFAPKLTVAVA